jgi:hypothetical protein
VSPVATAGHGSPGTRSRPSLPGILHAGRTSGRAERDVVAVRCAGSGAPGCGSHPSARGGGPGARVGVAVGSGRTPPRAGDGLPGSGARAGRGSPRCGPAVVQTVNPPEGWRVKRDVR